MTFLTRISLAFLCAGTLLAANAQEKNPHEAVQTALMSSLRDHDFVKLQAETDTWLRDYEANRITGDEFVGRMANLHPRHVSQTTPDSDAERWLAKYPKSYAANYLFGVVLSQTGSHLTNAYYTKGTKQEQRALFEDYSKRAEAQLLKSAELSKRPYPSYYRLIQVAADLNGEKSATYFARAQAIDPKAYAAQEALLRVLAPTSGDMVAAFEAHFKQAQDSAMSAADKRQFEAFRYEIMGNAFKNYDHEKASEFYRLAYRTHPAPETLWRLNEAAEIARLKGYYDRAIILYGEVLAIDPTHISARTMRAHVFAHRKNDFKSALADYLIAVKTGNISAQIELGSIYMDGRITKVDYDQAATYFKMAADQNNPTAIIKLRELEKQRKATPSGDARKIAEANRGGPPAKWVPILEAHGFAKLEKMSGKWLSDYARKKIGAEELMKHLSIFYPNGAMDDRWRKDVELWVERYPRSYAASYILGTILSETASSQRGSDSLRETSSLQMEAYEASSRLAEQQFLRSLSLYARPYPSYCGLVKIQKSDGETYYRKAVEIDPDALKAHALFMHYNAPKWGGSLKKIDAVIAQVNLSRMSTSAKRVLELQALGIKAENATIRHDSGLAFELYGKIIALDPANVRARIARGRINEKEKLDVKAAFADYAAAAASGDRWALNQVGSMYMYGTGVDQNFDTAETYFRKGEAMGDDWALRNLQILATARRGGIFIIGGSNKVGDSNKVGIGSSSTLKQEKK